jgi:hypothetical protein
MDEFDNMGPVLLPEEEAKLAKAKKWEKRVGKFSSHKRRILFYTCGVVGIGLLLVAGSRVVKSVQGTQKNISGKTSDSVSSTSTINQSKTIGGLQLNPHTLYGDKYAKGILPVGDKKYVTDTPKKGNIYLCKANFVPDGQAGAQSRGPWFVNNNTEWDSSKKPAIAGSINWTSNITVKIENGKRIIKTNDYPNHTTGVFPVASTDPAKQYDANPNSIQHQDLTYELSAGPSVDTPSCMGGEVGIMLTGVALFNAFDAGGRDAGAWEVQDSCDGHPQVAGEYHYHSLSRCIKNTSVHEVIGFALDGHPITGPKVAENSILTTDNLDECHGLVSEITMDGKKITVYHYVMTQDYPYSVSCFKSKPIQPPGQQHAESTPSTGQQAPAIQDSMHGPPPKKTP